MEQYRVLAMAENEYRNKIESILNTDNLNCVGILSLDENGLKKAMTVNFDCVVVMAYSLTRKMCELLSKIYMTRKNAVMILITDERDMDTFAMAMECGIGKILTADMESSSIRDSIVVEIEKSNSRGMDTEERHYDSKVISVFGTKGGAGKTTVAVNLAVALRQERKKVLLMDLDLQFGDVGVFLDIPRSDTIADLVEEGDFNAYAISSFLYRHSTGVNVLCAPNSPELAEIVKPEHIGQIVNALKKSLDYIIIDLGPILDECALQALDLSDTIYFVTNPEISTLKNTKICMNVLNTLNYGKKVKFILNKDGDSYVKRKDMESALDTDMVLDIPNEPKNTIAAINQGVPIVLSNSKSKVSKAIVKFAKRDDI
jgi:pilus assembly protein CpaE